ncbi:MAG: response regulator [Lachnospiraceae bacterium]|nr:response regulator [Lachnospiraceae bacterium]
MEKNIRKFLRNSFVSVISVCVLVFIGLVLIMGKRTEDTIDEISEIYMSEMNTQLGQKFTSIIGLRLEQVQGLIRRTPPDTVEYNEDFIEELTIGGEVREFTFLGLYAEDGEMETIYGGQMTVSQEAVTQSLKKDGNIVAMGLNDKDERMLILGRGAEYPMKDGGKSIALVAGVPMDYLKEALFLDSEDTLVYTHIIDKDGNFVVRSGDAYRESYFERILTEAKGSKNSAEEYVTELQEAMEQGEPYAKLVTVNGEKRYTYCTPVSETHDWYLVTVMNNEAMDAPISALDLQRIGIMVGSSVMILVAMSVVFLLYFRFSIRQMEELNDAKQKAIRSDKAKSEFLSSMSHDIRTPMNAIIGMTEIALKNIKDPERVVDCLNKVKLSSKHLLGLINDVLDMSKIESGKMTLNMNQMSLREAMDDIVNIMQPQVKAKSQYFDIFIQSIRTEDVFCDSVRLNQVLLNLLSNATKFTPEMGRIDVHLYQEESPEGEDYVRTHFVVEDTGIGMSEEFQRKIFDSFEREDSDQVAKIMGTGLGMSITKAIVDLMKGTIQLTSEQGKGSKFHITLDLKKCEIDEKDMMLPHWDVLVVDDNEQLCTSAVANLQELGVHTEWSLEGRQAIRMIEDRHLQNNDYDFVLVDWKMPHMNGIEVIREMRNVTVGNKIPAFLISAYDWSELEEEVDASEIEGFISKPLFKSTLYLYLKKYMEGEDFTDESEEVEIDFEGKHILLAEDIDVNWEFISEILSSVGLVLERAINGKECLEMFEASEIGFYDAILMDIRMPVMNGYDATIAIRGLERSDNGLPIIAMTADAFSDDAQHCLEVGMDAHIAKPIDLKECMRTLQKYLNQE